MSIALNLIILAFDMLSTFFAAPTFHLASTHALFIDIRFLSTTIRFLMPCIEMNKDSDGEPSFKLRSLNFLCDEALNTRYLLIYEYTLFSLLHFP